MFKQFTILLIVFSSLIGFSQNTNSDIWVDSVFSTLSEEDKISQLIMVAAYSNKGKSHVEHISSLISKYKIGGLMFLPGSYASWILYGAWKRWPGYEFHQVPSYDE